MIMTTTSQFQFTDFQGLKAKSSLSELTRLTALQSDSAEEFQQFTKAGEGLFLVRKEGELIGIGTIEQSSTAPPTAGIALINNCFILPSERRNGYGNQLFQHLILLAKQHFGLLQLNDDCPFRHRMEGNLIDLGLAD